MTLPAPGTQIGFDTINNDRGYGTTASLDMNWLRNNSKSVIGGVTGVINNLYALGGLSYYTNNTQSNQCGNGNNYYSNCNCGNVQCYNCIYASPPASMQCLNCDTQNYYQPNCNCYSPFYCTPTGTAISYNCNCSYCW